MKFFYLMILGILFCLNGIAQNQVTEPDFVGEVLAVLKDNTVIPLEKANVQVKVTDQLMGPTKKLYVPGKSSPVRLKAGKIQLIVRAVDNNTDPVSIIRVFSLSGKKTRTATIAKQNELTGKISDNQYKYVSFIGKKYGTSSYLLTIDNITSGEYGITVNNPNSVDEKMLIVSCFGVD